MGDAEMRKALGQAGRARVQEVFSLTRMVRRHEELFEELLARTTPAF
jgi:glycosyltransferase involved in cell wall biosynthesis